MKSKLMTLAAMAVATVASNAQPNLEITEFMYTGLYGEFTEVFNVGSTDADLNEYFFADSSGPLNEVSLAVSGGDNTLGVNEPLIITEADPEIFALVWYTYPPKAAPTGLIIRGNVTQNLGRADTIKISRDPAGAPALALEDELIYGDNATAPFGPRTEDVSAVQSSSEYTTGSNEDGDGRWVISTTGLANTWKSGRSGATGTVGSPGYNVKAP